jgi:hypothetical protein
VAAVRVVPSLDEIEHRHAGLALGLEPAAVEQLAFERGEETLPHGIVETIIRRAHRRPHCDSDASPLAPVTNFLSDFNKNDMAVASALFLQELSVTDAFQPYHWQGKNA